MEEREDEQERVDPGPALNSSDEELDRLSSPEYLMGLQEQAGASWARHAPKEAKRALDAKQKQEEGE